MPGLTDLPREVRDHIYAFALVADHPISVLNFASDVSLVPSQHLGLAPALLRTNRSIYREAQVVLYGANTFCGRVEARLHHALRRFEVSVALQHLHILPEQDPPEPYTHCPLLRPVFSHPRLALLRRLIIKVEHNVPTRPHWSESDLQVSSAVNDLCQAFVEGQNLLVLTFATEGVVSSESWLPAAAQDVEFARRLEILMWHYHEWHFERVFLAAARSGCTFILDGQEEMDRIGLFTKKSQFFPKMRELAMSEWMQRTDKSSFSRKKGRGSHAAK